MQGLLVAFTKIILAEMAGGKHYEKNIGTHSHIRTFGKRLLIVCILR
jgi:hypothetical protein